MKLILASGSPRRKNFLTEYGYEFSVVPSTFDEIGQNQTPKQTVEFYAYSKAQDVFDKLGDSSAVVLGADTIVCLGGEILGKPKNKTHAVEMLKNLSGKTHQVITGYAIITKTQKIVDSVTTMVTFNQLTEDLINSYVDTGSPLDKAGSYGIQDGFDLVKEYSGSLNNVIGLPIEIIKPILDKILK